MVLQDERNINLSAISLFGNRRKFLNISLCSIIFIEVSAHTREEINNISYSLF